MLDLTRYPGPWRARPTSAATADVVADNNVPVACDVAAGLAEDLALLPTLHALLHRCRRLLESKRTVTLPSLDAERRNLLQALAGLGAAGREGER